MSELRYVLPLAANREFDCQETPMFEKSKQLDTLSPKGVNNANKTPNYQKDVII